MQNAGRRVQGAECRVQGDKDNLVVTVLAEVSDGKIRRIGLCIIPLNYYNKGQASDADHAGY